MGSLKTASSTNNFGGSAAGRSQSAVAGMDLALSPKLLTDFRLGYLRYHVKTSKYDGNEALASNVGIHGLNLGDPFTAGAPAFFVQNASGVNGDGLFPFGYALGVDACNCPLLETEDQYQIVNNWTRILGTHSLKFGVDVRLCEEPARTQRQQSGRGTRFRASDTENVTNLTLTSPGGMGLGTFLLGDVTNCMAGLNISPAQGGG